MDSATQLRRVYADICRGYSLGSHKGSPVFIKHFTVFDYTEVDGAREEAFDSVVKRGIKTEAEKLQWLESNGLWTKKDDQELAVQESYLESLRKTRSKMPYKAQIDQINVQIKSAEIEVNKLTNKRVRLLDKTAEQVADQKVQYEYMRFAFFSDSGLKTPLLTREDVEQLSGRDADSLLFSYINSVNQFSLDCLRRISIGPFFTNSFYLCGDDITRFFLRPVVDLTIYQTNLLSYGSYFKSLMTQTEIPKEMANNPDKIEEFVARSRNMKSLVNKAGAGDRVALIGAAPEDFKALGVEDGSAVVRADINKGIKSGLEAAKTREVTFNKPR